MCERELECDCRLFDADLDWLDADQRYQEMIESELEPGPESFPENIIAGVNGDICE